jgi:hypothetical protein
MNGNNLREHFISNEEKKNTINNLRREEVIK